MTSARPPFHLAFPVHDLGLARDFYGGLLGCPEGRSSEAWVDFDLRGHQIVAHLVHDAVASAAGESGAASAVDGDQVPVRHFGLVLGWGDWEALAQRVEDSNVPFLIAPRVRFQGQAGEQGTFFVRDPSGNALEFKAFREASQLFAQRVKGS